MGVPDEMFDAWQFIDIVDGLDWSIRRHDSLYMIDDVVSCWEFI